MEREEGNETRRRREGDEKKYFVDKSVRMKENGGCAVGWQVNGME